MQSSRKNSAIWFIFITLIIDITGWGIVIPVVPKLIEELINGDVSEASKYGGWLSFLYAFMQFLFAPVLGNLSDKFGRRPVILFSLLGFSINFFIQAWAPTIFWLFIGRIFSGITGASITTASAYIADISDESNRSKNFGMIGAAFGLGFIIGPVIGGLLGQYGSRVPFYAAAILCLVNFAYGYFILPESLSKENRRPFDIKRANPVGTLLKVKNHPEILKLFIAWFLVYLASHAVQTNWSFFTIYKFHWDEKMVGISLGVMGIFTALVQGFLIRRIHPKLGVERSILYGIMFYSLGMLLFSFANKDWMMFGILAIYTLGGIAGPALQSVISAKVSPKEQGDLQGALTSVISITSIIGPLLMTQIFYFFTHPEAKLKLFSFILKPPFQFSGAPFFLGFILMTISAYFVYYVFHKKK